MLLACCQGSKPVFISLSDSQCLFLDVALLVDILKGSLFLYLMTIFGKHLSLITSVNKPSRARGTIQTLPYPTLPCPALPCPALPCPALPCPAQPYPTIPKIPYPYHTLPNPSIPYLVHSYSSIGSDVAWESRGTSIDPRVRHIFS